MSARAGGGGRLRRRPRLAALAVSCAALAAWIACALGQGSAPALGDRPPAKKPAPPPNAAATRAALTPAELAAEAKSYEDIGGYARALETQLELEDRVKPDADLEIAIALNEARAGRRLDAWKRLYGPLLTAAEHDSMPTSRRRDYQSERAEQWLNGAFDGWHWYIVRARAELGAALGRWHEARAAAEACVAARPLAGKEWLILAVCAGHDGDLEAAKRAASTALDLDPTLPEAYYLDGVFAWRDGRRAEAQHRFRGAVSLDSTYRAAAAALVRCRLPFVKADSLPAELLTGVREAGLVTSPAGPKLEEFAQMDMPATIARRAMAAIPDSLRRGLPPVQMTLPVLVDARGRIVMHELPWFEAGRIRAPVVSVLLSSLPLWRFRPAIRHNEPQPMWTAIPVELEPGH